MRRLPAFAAARAPGIAGDNPHPDKSAYTLLKPTPSALMRDMSTDRPDTTESPYTVDAGHAQKELSFVDVRHDSDGSQTSRGVAVMPMLLFEP